MRRTRVAGIIFMQGGIALMHRTEVKKRKDYQDYYTFPGGGLEEGETKEEGTTREIKEELGINVKVIKKLYEMNSKKFEQKEIFYLCEYIDGKFGTGDGPEFSDNLSYKDTGNYIPEIISIEKIKDTLLLPLEIKEKLLKDIKSGIFKNYISLTKQ